MDKILEKLDTILEKLDKLNNATTVVSVQNDESSDSESEEPDFMPTDFDHYEKYGITTCKTGEARSIMQNCLAWVRSVIHDPTTWDETLLEIYEAYGTGNSKVPVPSAMVKFLVNLSKYLRSINCLFDGDLASEKIEEYIVKNKEVQITRTNKINYTFDDIRNITATNSVDKLLQKLFGDTPNDGNVFPILRPDEITNCVVIEHGDTPPIDMNYVQDGIFYNNFNKSRKPYSFKIDDDLLQFFPQSGLVLGTTNRHFPTRRLQKLTGNSTVTSRDLRQMQCNVHKNKPYAFQLRLAELLGHTFKIHKSMYDHLQYEPEKTLME